jgi:hypothetical protein
MYFIECARLAEQHVDLAAVFERLDSEFRTMRTVEILRPEVWSSFLNVDPNQMRSALDMLAEQGVLRREEMIECRGCEMVALLSDYRAGLEEDGEYRCTDCDRPLTDGTIELITTYRRGEKWQGISNRGGDGLGEASSSSTPSNVALDEQAWYTHDRLAPAFNVGKDALRKRLDRYREHNMNGWKENDDRRPREAKYLYRLRDVKGIIQELRASSQRPAK